VIEVTLFERLEKPKGRRHPTTWPALWKSLSRPRPYQDKHAQELWAPVVFDGDYRNLENVQQVFALTIDFDDGNASVEQGKAKMLALGLGGFLHTTRSHTPELHSFRIVIPLSRPVSFFEYYALWRRVAPDFGQIDPLPKDPSRGWFVPATPDPDSFQSIEFHGQTLDVNASLRRPEPAPPAPAHQGLNGANGGGAHIPSGDVFDRARRYLAVMDPAIQGSGGSVPTLRAAIALVRGFDLSDADSLALLESEYNPRCVPPWSHKELVHKIRSAREKGRMPFGEILRRGNDWAPPRWDNRSSYTPPYEGEPEDIERQAIQEEPERWGHPAPLGQIAPVVDAPFPLHALPATLARFSEEMAIQLQVPVAMVAAMTIAALSTCTQKRWQVEMNKGWREPLQTFWCVCAEPGEKKSAVMNAIKRPIEAWERSEAERLRDKVTAATTEWKTMAQQAEALMKLAAKSNDSERMQEAKEAAVALDHFKVPQFPRLIAEDITPEALAWAMKHHGGKIAILDTEGGIFATFAGRYSNGVSNIDVLLKGHAGDSVRVDRKNGTAIDIRSASLTIGLMVQPSVLLELASKPDFRGRGALARFQFILAGTMQGYADIAAPVADPSTIIRYNRLLTTLLSHPIEQTEGGEDISQNLYPDRDAQKTMFEFRVALEPRKRQTGDLYPIRDYAGKFHGLVARIAGLLALANWADANPRGPLVENPYDDLSDGFEEPALESAAAPPITGQDMQSAIAIADYLLHSTQVAYSALLCPAELGTPTKIVAWLTKEKKSEVSRRDIQRGTKVNGEQLDAALDMLEQHGYIRKLEQQPRGQVKFAVNPAMWSSTV
jgi:replicative DNA helicase